MNYGLKYNNKKNVSQCCIWLNPNNKPFFVKQQFFLQHLVCHMSYAIQTYLLTHKRQNRFPICNYIHTKVKLVSFYVLLSDIRWRIISIHTMVDVLLNCWMLLITVFKSNNSICWHIFQNTLSTFKVEQV